MFIEKEDIEMFFCFPVHSSLRENFEEALLLQGVRMNGLVAEHWLTEGDMWRFAGGKPNWFRSLTGIGCTKMQSNVQNFLRRNGGAKGFVQYEPSLIDGQVFLTVNKVSFGVVTRNLEAKLFSSFPIIRCSTGGRLVRFPNLLVQAYFIRQPEDHAEMVIVEGVATCPSEIMPLFMGWQKLAVFRDDHSLSVPNWLDFAHGCCSIMNGQKMTAEKKAAYIAACEEVLQNV